MRKYYELEMELVLLQAQDVITSSVIGGFAGEDDDFTAPTPSDAAGSF